MCGSDEGPWQLCWCERTSRAFLHNLANLEVLVPLFLPAVRCRARSHCPPVMVKVKGKLAVSSSKSHPSQSRASVVPRSQSSLDASQFDVACHFTHHMRIHDEKVLPPRSQSYSP